MTKIDLILIDLFKRKLKLVDITKDDLINWNQWVFKKKCIEIQCLLCNEIISTCEYEHAPHYDQINEHGISHLKEHNLLLFI